MKSTPLGVWNVQMRSLFGNLLLLWLVPNSGTAEDCSQGMVPDVLQDCYKTTLRVDGLVTAHEGGGRNVLVQSHLPL